MPSSRYRVNNSDLDALELTLVRSLENLRETLPQTRRQIDTFTPTLGQSCRRANTIASPSGGGGLHLARRRPSPSTKTDAEGPHASSSAGSRAPTVESFPSTSSWKNYIKEHEAQALERQMDYLRQDMRDLADARKRRSQELLSSGNSALRRTKRLPEAIPQRRTSYPVHGPGLENPRPRPMGTDLVDFPNSSFNNPTFNRSPQISTLDQGLDVIPAGSGTISDSSNQFRISPSSNGVQPKLHTAARLPRVPTSREISHPAAPTSGNHLSKSITHLRSFSAPGPMSPRPPATFAAVSPAQGNVLNAGKELSHKGAGELSSEGSRNNRRSSLVSSSTVSSNRRNSQNGEKKVRFVENLPGVGKGTRTENYRERLDLAPPSPLASLPPPAVWSSPSYSVSITISTSREEGPKSPKSKSTSPTSSDDEETGATAAFIPCVPASPPDPMPIRVAKTHPTIEGSEGRPSVIEEEVKIDRDKRSGLTLFYPPKGRSKVATAIEESVIGETVEQTHGGGGLNEAENSITFVPTKGHSFSQDTNTHQPSSNKRSNRSIRVLLRKRAESLMNRFSWSRDKSGSSPDPVIAERGELECIVCFDQFNRNSLIQVPGKCLHLYCKGCLKGMFLMLKNHVLFWIVHVGLPSLANPQRCLSVP